jgi:hypothetical protein
MSDRRTYDVSPDGDGGWNVKRRGNDRATGNFENKDDAIDSARGHAKGGGEGQVVIRGRERKSAGHFPVVAPPENTGF